MIGRSLVGSVRVRICPAATLCHSVTRLEGHSIRTTSAVVAIVFAVTAIGSAVTALPTLVMEWKRADSPEVLFYVGTREPVVALSIDDGPSEATPEILEVLAANDAHATFFVIGQNVLDRPDLARRMLAEGHELGHHMMVDEPSIDLSPSEFHARGKPQSMILPRM